MNRAKVWASLLLVVSSLALAPANAQALQGAAAPAGVVDNHKAPANAENGFRAEWTVDGVHPNAAGYKIMDPIAENALKLAVQKKR